jgi:AraC family transcriptional regulator
MFMGLNGSSRIEHNGEIIDSKQIAGFYLTETVYAPNVKVPRHSHRHACFCFVLEGTYRELYRRKAIECRPSNLIFRPAEEVHADHFGALSVRCFIIEIEPEWLARLRERSIRVEGPASFHAHSLAWLAMRLRNESRQADDFTSLTVEGLILEVVAEVARNSTKSPGLRCPRWLSQAQEMLHERFSERLTLSHIAESVGVHPAYLAWAFRRHHRCSVGEYVRRLRIEFACRELSRTAAPLVDIALTAGFAHQAHFSRTFKRLTGLTPAQYRAAARPS